MLKNPFEYNQSARDDEPDDDIVENDAASDDLSPANFGGKKEAPMTEKKQASQKPATMIRSPKVVGRSNEFI